MKLKMVYVLFLLLISFSVFADTYNKIGFYNCPTNTEVTNGAWFSNSGLYSLSEECQSAWISHLITSTRQVVYSRTVNYSGTTVPSVIYYWFKTSSGSNIFEKSSSNIGTCPGGGTISNQSCINAPACTGTDVRNETTGICGAPPPDPCPPVNTVADIGVKQAEPPSIPDGMLTIGISSFNDSSLKAVKDGSEYAYTPEDFTGTCYNKTDGVYCNYHAKSTGVCNVTTSDSIDASTGTTQANSKNGQCLTDPKGNTLCRDNPEGNRKCGLVNGSKICVDATAGTGTVNGQPYQTSAKNCGYLNGEPVCVSNDAGSLTTVGCVKNGGVQQCVNHDVTKNGSTTVTPNPDGTTTTTDIVTSNIIGRPDEVSTKSCDSVGNCTTQTSGGDDGTLEGIEKAAAKAECEKEGNKDTAGCLKAEKTAPVKDVIDTTNVQTTMTVGSYNSGSCPAPQSISLSRGQYSLSNQPLCDLAAGTKPLLVAMAYLAAGYIVLGSVRGD